MHPSIDEYIQSLILAGRAETARGYRHSLSMYERYLEEHRLDPLTITTEHLRDYQQFLAEEYRTSKGITLTKHSQACRLSCIKSYYSWMERRSYTVNDPAKKIQLPTFHAGW